MGESRPFGRENLFCQKKTPKTACLGGHESEFPYFGRSCMPNYWHQVNVKATPENIGV